MRAARRQHNADARVTRWPYAIEKLAGASSAKHECAIIRHESTRRAARWRNALRLLRPTAVASPAGLTRGSILLRKHVGRKRQPRCQMAQCASLIAPYGLLRAGAPRASRTQCSTRRDVD
jgi:hypothetical protein